MHEVRELTTEELAAVQGGATNQNNGSLPHPKPSPVDDIIRWILGALR
jgi:bacteriocin-like protein